MNLAQVAYDWGTLFRKIRCYDSLHRLLEENYYVFGLEVGLEISQAVWNLLGD